MELNGKKNALKQQLFFKENTLKITKSGTHAGDKYEHILHLEDAENGYNFFCYNDNQEWNNLKDWANNNTGQKKKEVNFQGEGLRNMLRSEHIPYNMFFPLSKEYESNPKLVNAFLEELIPNIKVDKITKIKIEYVSELDKNDLLEDNTSFDAYIEYIYNNKKCGLGIELKYTEKSYKYGETEQRRLFDRESVYNKLIAEKSELFNCDFYKLNKKELKKLKQLLRNHLLGIKLTTINNQIEEFHSVHIYPKGNEYQKQACDNYINCLSNIGKDYFVPITFEKFIHIAKKTFGEKDWIKYLDKRYLFENTK